MATLNYVLRDPTTGVGLPGQSVKLRIGPGFASDTYTLSDVSGKPGAYELADLSSFASGEYELWVNGSKDTSFGRREIFKSSQLLFKSGGTMTGTLNMGGYRIENLLEPINVGDAVNFITLYTYYLAKSGGTMTGDISMDGNRVNDLPDSPVSDNEAAPSGWVTESLAAALEAYLKKDGSVAMTGDLNLAGKKIKNLPAPVANGEPLRYDEAVNFLDKRVSAAVQSIRSVVTFLNYCPSTIKEPTSLNNLTNRKFVEDYVNEKFLEIVAGELPVYQQSLNILRVIPSGTQEDGRVYRTLEAAVLYAAEYATSNRVYTILIEGNGVDGAVLTNYNLIPVLLPPYVNIVGADKGIKLVASEDSYLLNMNIIANVSIDNEGFSASTTFRNAFLCDVELTNLDATGVYELNNCILYGDNTAYGCTVSITGSSQGSIRDISNNRKKITYDLLSSGDYVIANQSGDIRGRRILGRQGANVASGNDIALGNGNYFIVTGTTSVEFIRKTDWEDGSVIYLEFSDGLTLINGSAGYDDLAGIITSTGANKSFASGKIGRFILTGSKTFWKEL